MESLLNWSLSARKIPKRDPSGEISGGHKILDRTFCFFFDCFDRFLPRLGAPITYVSISSDAKYYGLLFDDNTVKIVNAATLKVEKALVQAIKKGKFDWNVHFFDTFDTFDTFI